MTTEGFSCSSSSILNPFQSQFGTGNGSIGEDGNPPGSEIHGEKPQRPGVTRGRDIRGCYILFFFSCYTTYSQLVDTMNAGLEFVGMMAAIVTLTMIKDSSSSFSPLT